MILCKINLIDNEFEGARDGVVARALTSHQCGPGSNPGIDAICGLSLLLVLSFAPRGFLWVLQFFSQTNVSKFQFDQESGRRETTLWMCYPPNHIVIIIIINIFSAINYCFLHSPRTGANPWSWGTRVISNWWTATFSVCAQFLGWLWWWWWWWWWLELLDQSMSLDYNLLFLQPVIQAQSSPLHQRPFQRMKANSSL